MEKKETPQKLSEVAAMLGVNMTDLDLDSVLAQDSSTGHESVQTSVVSRSKDADLSDASSDNDQADSPWHPPVGAVQPVQVSYNVQSQY